MAPSPYQDICLHNELTDVSNLLNLGLKELRKCDTDQFKFLTLQLLSTGIERLLKCFLCLTEFSITGNYPSKNEMKNHGHNILSINTTIMKNHFSKTSPALLADFEFICNNDLLAELLDTISEFGKFARYHNLDVVCGDTSTDDATRKWEEIESKLISGDFFKAIQGSSPDFDLLREEQSRISSQVCGTLERYIRAIVRQFTLGNLGSKGRWASTALSDFLFVQDEFLGQDHSQSKSTEPSIFKAPRRSFIGRLKSKLRPDYQQKKYTRSDVKANDWPFFAESVCVEIRQKYWTIVIINNREFALNGSAQARFQLPYPAEAGFAKRGGNTYQFLPK